MAREIIKRVMITEKSNKLAALNQFFLEVDKTASKPEIRAAVEAQFGVHVLLVGVDGVALRQKVESTWKRAIVEVKAGERIEMV